MDCYFCRKDISWDVQVTMGEHEFDFECVCCVPCSEEPYPLAEISRVDLRGTDPMPHSEATEVSR